jgi:BMFP domain-containing protein YqiC
MLFTIFLGGNELDSRHVSLEQMVRDMPALKAHEEGEILKKIRLYLKQKLSHVDLVTKLLR